MGLETARARPVARLLAPVAWRLAVLLGVLALVAVVGIMAAQSAVDRLTGELQPAASANRAVLQDLTEMDAAVAGWALAREPAALDAYRQAEARLAGHQRQVRSAADGEAGLTRLVERRDAAVRRWAVEYAAVVLAADESADPVGRGLLRRGDDLMADAVAAQRATQDVLDRRARNADEDLTWILRGTILVVVALTVLGWAVVGRTRRRLLAELSEPLLALESVVHRMARRDPLVRAEQRGPKEVRAVATALNDLADAQARARAVEARIQDELRVLDTAKDDFVSNVSHELRTPLTTISGYLEMVAEEFEGRMDPPHERMLEATRRNVARLKALIDDLLTLSKAESRPAELEHAELGAILGDAVTDVRITAAGRGVRLDVDLPDGALPVLADRAMLQRAFLNVLTNAVKFSREDGRVEVAVRREDGDVLVAVADHGIGIPAAELDRLGSRFFRASNAVSNEIAGTGLGLRIVQTIMDRHRGDVVIQSREGVGTTVTLRLRLLATVPVPAPTPPEADAVGHAVR